MLVHLAVENYALIDQLEIDLLPGMTIITGETGAGKSILLGALSLVVGQRADAQVLLDKNRKCIVEAIFDISDYNLDWFFESKELDFDTRAIIRREINPQGKSRAFINDTPVNLNVLKDLSDLLIDIHSQHHILEINEASFQISVIDSFAKQQQQLKIYQKEYKLLQELEKKLERLVEEENRARTDQDYFQFQFDELHQAVLSEVEKEALENEFKVLSNAGSIREHFLKAQSVLRDAEDNVLSRFAVIQQLLSGLVRLDPSLADLQQRFDSQYIELKDLSNELDLRSAKVVIDPARAEIITARLDLIYRLIQKHRVSTVTELLSIMQGVEEKLMKMTSLENEIGRIRSELAAQLDKVKKAAEILRKGREKAIPPATAKLIAMLKNLGMPDARIRIECLPAGRYHAYGSENIRFLFNANKGGELKELSRIASGGELSRLMLSVKSLVSQKNLLPTIIFDEIDSGVSGEVAGRVGEILYNLSRNMQVIAITHLPQIAARGNMHLQVFKRSGHDVTHTFIRRLNDKERETEIAQMIGGTKFSESTLLTARELIARK